MGIKHKTLTRECKLDAHETKKQKKNTQITTSPFWKTSQNLNNNSLKCTTHH